MTNIYLIRHGEAEGNAFRRLHGQYDSLLTPRGHRQVECLRRRFENIHIDACFASDLTRASLTSKAIYEPKGLKLHRDCRFREVDVGCWEDLPYGYLKHFEPELMRLFDEDPRVWHVEGSETYEEYTGRFLQGLTEAAERFDGGTIAVFAHGAAIRSTLIRLFFMDDISKLPYSDNTGVSLLRYENGNFSYEFINDNSHIPGELSRFYLQRRLKEMGCEGEATVYFEAVEESCDIVTIAALLKGREVGRMTLGQPQGNTAIVLNMTLDSAMEGRRYTDQMLGEVFSRARKQGCENVQLMPGAYPEDIITRYEFDPGSLKRSIDVHVYRWEEATC